MQSGSFVRSKLGVVQIFIISAPLGLGKRSLLTNGGTKGYNKKQHHQKNQGVHTGLNVVFGTVWCHSCQSNKYFTHSTVWNLICQRFFHGNDQNMNSLRQSANLHGRFSLVLLWRVKSTAQVIYPSRKVIIGCLLYFPHFCTYE